MKTISLLVTFWVLLCLLIYMLGCGATLPSWNGSIWLADPPAVGITRVEEEPIGRLRIHCGEAQFGEYLCMSYSDFTDLYKILLECKDWGSAQMMSEQEKKSWSNKYQSLQQMRNAAP